MSMQISVPETTAKGGLHSITDQYAQYTPGTVFETPHPDGDGIVKYIYGYNGTGAACVQNMPVWLVWGADGTNPKAIAVADGQAYYGMVAVPQSAIPSTYWGWYHFEGPTINRMYHDAIDANATLTTVDGQGLSISSGVCVTAALAWTDEKDFAVSTEARTAATTSHCWLFGKITLSTA